MDSKKVLGLILTLIGGIGMTAGVVMLFTGNLGSPYAWIGAILGLIFFSSGIGLMKSSKTTTSEG